MAQIRKIIMLPNRRNQPNRIKSWDDQVLLDDAGKFLELLSICQELHVLPKGGGLLDQDSYFVHLMKYALVCQQDRRELDNHKNVQKQRELDGSKNMQVR